MFRWARDDTRELLLLEKWDPKTKTWIDWPDLLRASGIGGDSHFVEIDPSEARVLAGPDVNLWPEGFAPA